jgi:hypothetical protein
LIVSIADFGSNVVNGINTIRIRNIVATLLMTVGVGLTQPGAVHAQQNDGKFVINAVLAEQSDTDRASATEVTLDESGNRYLFGRFTGNVEFGAGRGAQTLNGTDGDLFVAKYDTNGNLQWVQEFETSVGSALPSADAVTIDFEKALDNLYVGGAFRGRLTVGGLVMNSGQEADGFVAQLDPATGAVKWVNQMIGTQPLIVRDLSANSGNVTVTGRFTGIGDFPGQFQTKKTLLSLTPGGEDMFAVMYSPAGESARAVQAGGNGAEGSAVYMDNSGAFTVVGDFAGTIRFPDASSPRQLTSQAGDDGFVARYTRSGQLRFVTQVSGPDSEAALFVTQKRTDLYVAGAFRNQVRIGTATLTSRGDNDTYVARISSLDGSVQRIFQIGSNGLDFVRGLDADSEDLVGGKIYVTGSFPGPQLTIGDGSSAIQLNKSATTNRTAYLTAISVDGGNFTPRFGQVVQGKFNNNRITVDDNSANLFLAGGYEGAATFGEGARIVDLPAPTGTEALALAHFTPEPSGGGGDQEQAAFYVSSTTDGAVDGISFTDEDVLAFSTLRQRWTLLIDGSDIGLGATDINAFLWQPDGTMLLAVNSPISLPGLGIVDDSDIVRFLPQSLGATTTGTFELFLRGADVGLTTDNEDIDAITKDTAGRLVISTLGDGSVPSATGTLAVADEDLIVLNGNVWELLFDGSDVGLTDVNEDLSGAWIDDRGFTLVTLGAYTMPALSGDAGDIFRCLPTSTGENTGVGECKIIFDSAANRLAGEVIDAFSIGRAGVEGTEHADNNDDRMGENAPADDDIAEGLYLPLVLN